MNHKLFAENKPEANGWANKVVQAFKRDSALAYDYNNVMSGGKWKNMMIQKHIGYTTWNDNFRADVLPEVYRIKEPEKAVGKYVFAPSDRYVFIEAEHFYERKNAPNAQWDNHIFYRPYIERYCRNAVLPPPVALRFRTR
jgi:hypothetical protein